MNIFVLNKSVSTLTTSVFFYGLLSFNLICLPALAESSFELSCRNKAKEIAAETYKSCVTEQKQAQLEQIRSDYKKKLDELKNHYDKELKKISGKNDNTSETTKQKTIKSNESLASTTSGIKSRPSGARSLPRKAVKTELIDLTSPSNNENITPPTIEDVPIQSQNRLKSDVEPIADTEVVELPSQE